MVVRTRKSGKAARSRIPAKDRAIMRRMALKGTKQTEAIRIGLSDIQRAMSEMLLCKSLILGKDQNRGGEVRELCREHLEAYKTDRSVCPDCCLACGVPHWGCSGPKCPGITLISLAEYAPSGMSVHEIMNRCDGDGGDASRG